MNIICRKENLADAIQATSKATANRSTLPILEYLLLEADGAGIHMMGNDLQIGIRYNDLEGEIIEEGSVALEAKIFSDIIRKLPAEEVLIKSGANQITIIKSGKAEFKILGLPGNEFPGLPEIPEGPDTQTLTLNASVLRDMLKKTLFSIASEESSKPVFTGELFEMEDGILHLVSTDSFRISQISHPISGGAESLNLIVPGKALNEILKILPEGDEAQVSIYATDKHILFSFGRCLVVSRLLRGDFLRYKHSFEVKPTTTVEANRESLWMSLERASLISAKEAKKYPVKLDIGSDTLTITTNTEAGASYEEMSIQVEGEPLEIAFNPKYLLDVLKAMGEEQIRLYFTTSLSPVIIKGDASYRYLVLPLRLKNDY